MNPSQLDVNTFHLDSNSIWGVLVRRVDNAREHVSAEISSLCFPPSLQEFSLLQLDDVADQRVNILGFSVFNKTHPFFQDFVISLNRSWQENCDHAPFAGIPVSALTDSPLHRGGTTVQYNSSHLDVLAHSL